MKIVWFLFLMVAIASCDLRSNNEPHPPSQEALVNELRNQTFKQLKEEIGLRPFGVGGRMMDQIKVIGLNFHYYKEVDINQARKLLMVAGKLLMSNVNINEQIRPHLENYPFGPNNIRIRIFFRKPNGSKVDLDNLSVATLVDGILDYDITSSETGRLKTIYEETFEDAAFKLNTCMIYTNQ